MQPTHDVSVTGATSYSEAHLSKFYAFGWNALPTVASVNEVCRNFLYGRCPFQEHCYRIHPRESNSPESSIALDGPATLISTAKILLENKIDELNVTAATSTARGASRHAKVLRAEPASTAEKPSGLPKNEALSRYYPGRGFLQLHSDPDVNSGQKSDDNQPLVNTSLTSQDSAFTLTSEDDGHTSITTEFILDLEVLFDALVGGKADVPVVICVIIFMVIWIITRYRHEDLEYDPVKISAFSTNSDSIITTEGRAWTVKVHDHAKVKLGPGFDIQELETGFETPWIYLGNVPNRVPEQEVAELLQPFGEVVDVRLPSQKLSNPFMHVQARFTTPASARDASTALHGSQAFGQKITARLPIHVHDGSNVNATFINTSVRIRWEVPSRTAYCGYSTMERAEAGMQAARNVFRDRYVYSSVHIGLPVVGVVTIRFRGLPIDINKEDMAWFAKPDDVVWAQPNYKSFDTARSSIKHILQRDLELLDFFILSPPYKHSQVQAWAHFATPNDAKIACGRLHGRKPVFTGKTRIFAEHLQCLTLSVSSRTYGLIRNDIQSLLRTVSHLRRTAISIVERPAPMKTLVKLSGEDLKELGQLKAEVEKILNWEIVRQGTSIAWDPFFADAAGLAFLSHIECNTENINIRADIPRRMIQLLGSSSSRSTVREKVLVKLTELQAQQVRTVPLDGWQLVQLMRSDLMRLQEQYGRDNINLDFHSRRLIVRGNDTVYQEIREAVHHAHQAQLHSSRRRSVAVCPVCFDEVMIPVTLPCGHTWCRDCIARYLTSSVNNRYFPLTCLGKNAKCTELIPLQVARKVLTIPEFDSVLDAAYAAYIHTRSEEFHYCPTPDCPQTYRRAPRDTVLQCPSCLLRICPNCHVEAHDGFACPDPEGDKNLFREWMKNHDVKPCPGCKVLIERAEGCNHMTCTQCKTHICWVCLQTFPGGNGIYDHMRTAHGGIGLAD
ncbi:hypothetical protein H0H87_005532 [Tephrocybe sp. NHM501043]|nr:hypothetical protein H0H87_005532 [Tephrocybe sp. NHM501043]